MTLLAVRVIDIAIFASLGGLWIGGVAFIIVLYRWILRRERQDTPRDADASPSVANARAQPAVRPQLSTAS